MGGDAPKGRSGDRPGADDEREAEDREAILRRRARFVAAALSGLAIGAASCEGSSPQPCLEAGQAATGTGQGGAGGHGGQGGQGGAPMPCLDVSPDTSSSSSSGQGGSGDGGAYEGGGGASPCLAPRGLRSDR